MKKKKPEAKQINYKLYFSLGILFGALLISLYLKIIPVLNYNFPFTMDQARDMLDIREIVVGLHPTLIGPTTSINGVYLGPFYYYFNALPFFVSGGDPAALVYWNILWYTLAAAALFYSYFKKDLVWATLIGGLFLVTPTFFYSSRFFWSANPMPYVTAFYFISLIYFILNAKVKDKSESKSYWDFILRRDFKAALLAGLISGLSMQFEAAFGVLFFPFLIIYSIIRKVNYKNILGAILGFGVTLLPQALFEIRHGFVMTNTFINEVSGESQILGEKLTFSKALNSHYESFVSYFHDIFAVPDNLTYALTIISVLYLVFNFRKLTPLVKEYFLASVLFVIFAFIFYSWYLHPLKGWYLLGIRVPYLIILTLFFAELFKIKNYLLKAMVIIFIGISLFNTVVEQSKFVPEDISDFRSNDKSNLRNEIEAVDWAYQKANGQGFKAYNYIPSVYDFPYQYLYWWHGTKTYGYQPETITYLDGVPEYIKDNEKFLTKKKPAGEDPLIMLIYEKDESAERLNAWLGDFTEYCPVEKQIYKWDATVEARKLCTTQP